MSKVPTAEEVREWLARNPTGQSIPATRAVAQQVLLENGGQMIIAGLLRTFAIKSVGAGVYRVFLLERREKAQP